VALTRSAAIAVVGLIVVAPWIIYIATTFPNEASWSSRYTLMHMSQSLEGPPSSPFIFLLEQPRFFGELVWIPLVTAMVTARRRSQHDLGLVLIWVAIPYLTFSMMSTRLPGYVMIAAPAVFLIETHFCTELRRRLQQLGKRRHRVAAMALLVLLVALPARYLLEPTGRFERRERDPEASRELRRLSQRLGLPDAVIFNIPTPIEAMFYSPYTAYDRMPTAEEVHAIRARGISVVVYEPRDAPIDVPRIGPSSVSRPRPPDVLTTRGAYRAVSDRGPTEPGRMPCPRSPATRAPRCPEVLAPGVRTGPSLGISGRPSRA